MKAKMNSCLRIACVFTFCLLAGVRSASAFALLGPFAPWMTPQLSYQDGVSIGGPMNIGEGYRWNVPVITYGYDQSFLDFFGTNGVAAVDSAIAILNNLPPASQIDPSTFPLDSGRVNFVAQSGNLIDLQSYALALVLEHMGLAQPTRYVFCLHDFTLTNGTAQYDVLMRNFDPFTWQLSTNVNGISYADEIEFDDGVYTVVGTNFFGQPNSRIPMSPVFQADAQEILDDPSQGPNPSAVADFAPGGNGQYGPFPGNFFMGLTRDDVGGVAYLLSSNNVALESLIPGVQGVGTNTSNFVNTALRPGVEKITFQRIDYVSATNRVFPVITNVYVDSYISNGVVQQQTLQRVMAQPDIVFTARYIGQQAASRSGTTTWTNNGAPGNDGPGVIRPPVQINFNQLGPSLYNFGDYPPTSPQPLFPTWASFDATTNAPVTYPILPATNATTFHFILLTSYSYTSGPSYMQNGWNLIGQPNALFSLQTSTNLRDWVTVTTITNIGGTYTYYDSVTTNTPQRYFRTMPQ